MMKQSKIARLSMVKMIILVLMGSTKVIKIQQVFLKTLTN
jgi:hypothetical protein